jgi:hypothetical protein
MRGGNYISDWLVDFKDSSFMYRQCRDMNFVFKRCCEIKIKNGEYIGTVNVKDKIMCCSDSLDDVTSFIDKTLINMGFNINFKKIHNSPIIGSFFMKLGENPIEQINKKIKEGDYNVK